MPYPHSNADGKKAPNPASTMPSFFADIYQEKLYQDMKKMAELYAPEPYKPGLMTHHWGKNPPPSMNVVYESKPELPSSFVNPVRVECRVDGLGPKIDGKKFGADFVPPMYNHLVNDYHKEELIRRMFADMANEVIKEMRKQ